MSIQEKEILDLSWKYFQQHAQQRISFFNFFVIFSGLMTTALITTFQEKFSAHLVGIGIGLMLSFISIVFWKVDQRNKFLTKIGEEAIKELELNYQFNNVYPNIDKIKIFTYEGIQTQNLKGHKWWKIFTKQFSLGLLFNFIFLLFFSIGLIGAGVSVYYQVRYVSTQTPIEAKIEEISKRLGTLDLREQELESRILLVEQQKKQADY